MRACTNCGSAGHSRSNCPMPKPDQGWRSVDDLNTDLLPTEEQHEAMAALLNRDNPTWPRKRCLLRASIEWQKSSGPALLDAEQQRIRA